MYTGASQFALVGVLAAGGSPFAGLLAALLLGLRNAFYGTRLFAGLPGGLSQAPSHLRARRQVTRRV